VIAVQIDDIKLFMGKMFKEDTFDDFDLVSATIHQGIIFTLDGKINPDFYTEETLPASAYVSWVDYKNLVFSIIKGNKTPSLMKIVFAVSYKSKQNLVIKSNSNFDPEEINDFYINILFDSNGLKVITGTNYKQFTLDKSVESYFDDSILKFLIKNEIPFI